MTEPVEREIKLRFANVDEARTAILAAGAAPLHGRRLQDDCLLDTDDETLRRRSCVLRVRIEAGKHRLTYKGPAQPSLVKVREEIETVAGDGEVTLRILEAVGFHVWFRYQKYREEFTLGEVVVAIDETPIGVFVEIEGSEQGIIDLAAVLGRSSDDYVLDSYRGLFLQHRESHGLPESAAMVFEER